MIDDREFPRQSGMAPFSKASSSSLVEYLTPELP